MTSQQRERQLFSYPEVRTVMLLDCIVLRTVYKERPICHHEIRSHACSHSSLHASLHKHDSARNHGAHPPHHDPPAPPNEPASKPPQKKRHRAQRHRPYPQETRRPTTATVPHQTPFGPLHIRAPALDQTTAYPYLPPLIACSLFAPAYSFSLKD